MALVHHTGAGPAKLSPGLQCISVIDEPKTKCQKSSEEPSTQGSTISKRRIRPPYRISLYWMGGGRKGLGFRVHKVKTGRAILIMSTVTHTWRVADEDVSRRSTAFTIKPPADTSVPFMLFHNCSVWLSGNGANWHLQNTAHDPEQNAGCEEECGHTIIIPSQFAKHLKVSPKCMTPIHFFSQEKSMMCPKSYHTISALEKNRVTRSGKILGWRLLVGCQAIEIVVILPAPVRHCEIAQNRRLRVIAHPRHIGGVSEPRAVSQTNAPGIAELKWVLPVPTQIQLRRIHPVQHIESSQPRSRLPVAAHIALVV